MPITCEERHDSGMLSATRGEKSYVVQGTSDDPAARSAVLDEAPATYGGLYRDDPNIRVEYQGSNIYDAIVPYIEPAAGAPGVGDSSFSFDTGGGTQHVTQSKETTNNYAAAGKAAPDLKGAINYHNGAVDGCDIVVPRYVWGERHILAASTVTTAYKGFLYSLTGKTNNAPFKGTNANETLFMGGAGQSRDDGNYDVIFSFCSSPNLTGLSVGDIANIAKKGWEYLWVLYEQCTDQNFMIARPAAVYIERVYDEGNFANLGIGTT